MSRSAFLLVLAFVLPACGEDRTDKRPAFTPYRGGGAAAPGNDAIRVAQEIWVTYGDREKGMFPERTAREREVARRVAEALRQRVVQGEDIGLLAQTASDSPSARADGFSGVLARDRTQLDARDRAILDVSEGEVTPLVDWEGGWWFAKRIGVEHGRHLEKRAREVAAQAEAANLFRVRFRLIHFHHVDAWPDRFEADGISREQALESARAVLRELQEGADFATLADKHSWDLSGNDGGVALATDPLGHRSPWITRYDAGYTDTLLAVLFDPATPVGLHPRPIEHARGIDVVELLERRKVTPQELEATRRPASSRVPKERTPLR